MSGTRPKLKDTQSARAFIADNWRAEADVLFTVAWNRKDSIVTENDLVVAVYANHETAEGAVQELQRTGFDLKKLSIVGKDYHTEEHVVGYYNAGDRMKYWGKLGAFWGGIWGILFGAAFFAVPGVGPVLVAGPLVAWIVGALEGAAVVGGLSAIGAGLYSVGFPKDSVVRYEVDLKASNFLLIAHGTAEEIARAREIISRTAPQTVDIHTSQTLQPAGGAA
jgi:uncharacterized membrane protein